MNKIELFLIHQLYKVKTVVIIDTHSTIHFSIKLIKVRNQICLYLKYTDLVTIDSSIL